MTSLFDGRRLGKKTPAADPFAPRERGLPLPPLEAAQAVIDLQELQARAGRLNQLLAEKSALALKIKDLGRQMSLARSKLKETEWLIAQQLMAIAGKEGP